MGSQLASVFFRLAGYSSSSHKLIIRGGHPLPPRARIEEELLAEFFRSTCICGLLWLERESQALERRVVGSAYA